MTRGNYTFHKKNDRRQRMYYNKNETYGDYGTGNSKLHPMHKAIYRRMFLRLEIALDRSVLEGDYGTGIGGYIHNGKYFKAIW